MGARKESWLQASEATMHRAMLKSGSEVCLRRTPNDEFGMVIALSAIVMLFTHWNDTGGPTAGFTRRAIHSLTSLHSARRRGRVQTVGRGSSTCYQSDGPPIT